jgi:hypothetical protein
MPPRYLLTYFGTIVYLDVRSSMLRHGKLGEVPANVTAIANGETVSLVVSTPEGCAPVGDLGPAGCRFVSGDTSPCYLHQELHSPSLYTFHWSGRVLTAEEDGSVSLVRTAVGSWEVFLPVDQGEFDELRFILAHAWIQHAPLRIFQSTDIELRSGFELLFGDYAIALKAILPLIRVPLAMRPSRLLEISATYENWKNLTVRLFRPLIYLVAYGRDDIFECAEIAVKSLRMLGGWQADIMVITDRANVAKAARIERDVTAVAVQAHDTMDFALARYKAVEMSEMQQFQPIVYIDTDVVCNAPLDSLFHDLCFSNDLFALYEGLLLIDEDFYGKTLFERDPGVGSAEDKGLSTGILGFRNAACVKAAFGSILGSAYAFAREASTRDYFGAFDQPFANYVLRKGPYQVKSLENRAIVSLYIFDPSEAPADRRGLIHFAGGVGNATPKVERMRSYLAAITADRT